MLKNLHTSKTCRTFVISKGTEGNKFKIYSVVHFSETNRKQKPAHLIGIYKGNAQNQFLTTNTPYKMHTYKFCLELFFGQNDDTEKIEIVKKDYNLSFVFWGVPELVQEEHPNCTGFKILSLSENGNLLDLQTQEDAENITIEYDF